jgi:hypothetical protein
VGGETKFTGLAVNNSGSSRISGHELYRLFNLHFSFRGKERNALGSARPDCGKRGRSFNLDHIAADSIRLGLIQVNAAEKTEVELSSRN